MSGTDPECRRLAAELRALRSRAGLSLVQLSGATTYSKSSWERYLNAKSLPPWSAAQELCRIADGPEPELRALWELAEAAWSGRGVVATGSTDRTVPTAPSKPTPKSPMPAAPVKASQPLKLQQVSASADAVADAAAPSAGTDSAGADGPPSAREAGRASRLRSSAALFAAVALVCASLTAGAAYVWRTAGAGEGAGSTPVPYWSAVALGCKGRTCDGEDPQQTGCGMGPTTLGPDYLTTRTGADLQVRYSKACETTWVKAWNTQVDDTVSISTPGEPAHDVLMANNYLAEDGTNTPMVVTTRSGADVRVCLTPAGAPNAPQCFTERVP